MNIKIIKEVPDPKIGLLQFIKQNNLTVSVKHTVDSNKKIQFKFNIEGFEEEFMEGWGRTIKDAIDIWLFICTNSIILVKNSVFVFKEEELVKEVEKAYKDSK